MPREDATTAPRLTTPTAVGTGLVTLDVIFNEDTQQAPRCFAGGTCGNVLTILSYLGWHSAPLSRLSPGAAAESVLADLRKWEVSTEFVSVEDDGSTPIIIQRIARTATGAPYHSFSWRCPGCGAHLPGYKPLLAGVAKELAGRLPASQVFFFDRVSRAALHLAKACSDAGAVVVFEPSGVGDPNLFREAWRLAHIVKYSHERLRDIADLELKRSERESVLLEVETLGADGLRYRSRLPRARTNRWRQLHAFKPQTFKDAAGSGDWCTAGLLNRLAPHGLVGFRATGGEKLLDALRYGQALASWNCGFEGARGGMYQLDKPTFERQVEKILKGGERAPVATKEEVAIAANFLARFCPSCNETEFGSVTPQVNGAHARG
jgi:sugar/nucleoside kinase (ribokinase family)